MLNIPHLLITPSTFIYDSLDPFTDVLSDIEMKRIYESPNNQNWLYISLYKNLSKEFIAQFSKYLNYKNIMQNGYISNDIKDYCRMFA